MPLRILAYCLFATVLVLWNPRGAPAQENLRIVSPDGGQIRSLLIGIDAYEHVRPLKGAVADAKDVEKSLRAMGANDVTTLIDAAANRDGIVYAISEILRRTTEKDLVILSIAGHGSQEPESVKGSEPDGMENVFLLSGFEPTARGSKQRILGSEFKYFIHEFELKGAKVLFVADTCHGGGMTRAVDPRAEEMSFRQVATYTLTEDTLKPIRDAQESLTDLDLDRTAFLAAVDRNTKAPEVRIPGIDGLRGALSYAVARALEGNADEDRDGRVTLKELFSNVRQVVYQLSDQRQNIVTKASPGLVAGSDVVFQLTRGINPNAIADSAPGAKVPSPAAPQTTSTAATSDDAKSTKAKSPVRLAALDGNNGYFSDVKPRDASIEVVRPIDNPDLIWDPKSHDVIAWGDVVAYNVDASDLASVVDRTAAVRDLKRFSTKAPQTLRLTAGDDQHRNDDIVQIALTDVAQRSILMVNLSSDGTVQMLYPLGSGTAQNEDPNFRISLRVRRPFGADQIIAITSAEPLALLEQAVLDLNRTRAPGALVKGLLRYMPPHARIGSIGIFTAP